jgi:uncharacterized metal-binding protein YceD (DUF177 family)
VTEPATLTTPLDAWSIEVRSISETGQNAQLNATPVQCASLAQALDLVTLDSLSATYKLRSLHRGRYRLTGRLYADVVQACIVTLDPVPAKVDEPIDMEFWPAEQLTAAPKPGVTQESSDEHNDTADFNALGDEPAEPIDQGRIPLGRIVYELLSAGLDPYPRSPGAAFDWKTKDVAPDNPFAVLAKLKPAGPAKDQ